MLTLLGPFGNPGISGEGREVSGAGQVLLLMNTEIKQSEV